MLLSKHRSVKLLIACLMAVGFFLPATMNAQAAPATVNGVSVSNSGSGMLKVNVKANAPLSYTSSRVSKGREIIVVDVSPAVLASNAATSEDVNRGLLEKVVLSQLKSEVVRVSLYVVSQPKFEVSSDANGLAIAVASSLEGAKVAQAPTKVAAAPSVKSEVSASSSKKVVAAAPKKKATAKKATKKVAKKAAPVKTVNLELVNADLVYVVKYLAKEMGRNVYVAPDVAGAVTVTLNKVRPEGALALILKMQEVPYDYKLIDNTIVVATSEKLSTVSDNILNPKTASAKVAKNAVTQEFFLEAAPAAKIMEFLGGQYPDVVFTAHPTMNGFYARGSVEDLKGIKSSLPNLDQMPPAPAPPRREYLPVNYAKVADMATAVKSLVPDAQVIPDERLSLLIVEGSDEIISRVEEVLANLDRNLEQVMLDCKVVDLSESGSKTLGIQWSDSNGSMGTFSTTFAEVLPSLFYDQGMIAENDLRPGEITYDEHGVPSYTAGDIGAFNIGTFGRTPFMINATLQMVVTNSDGKVLASPRVATQSGEQAKIHVGDKYPIVFYDSHAGQFQVNYVDIGTKINVKPEVKTDGYILVDIEPNVSSLVELINNQYPRTAERTIKTKMRVKDGDTIVLGGMVREEERRSVSKIPLLGDLPILGPLFRTTTDSNSRTEVILMLTTHIMK
ncbi:MAG: secretin N-terminal domain-containing protein [bacterium]|nr:secretin N-terminal domain-containing protein [bacterium]